ncbi:MAG: proteasome activator [Actinomycetota bacterium]
MQMRSFQVPAPPADSTPFPNPPEEGDETSHEIGGAWSKLLRIAAMTHELLHEIHTTNLDEAGRRWLLVVYTATVEELKALLPPELRHELEMIAPPLSPVPSESELRLAQVQLGGWIEGLMSGINAAMWSQVVQGLRRAPDDRKVPEDVPAGQYL